MTAELPTQGTPAEFENAVSPVLTQPAQARDPQAEFPVPPPGYAPGPLATTSRKHEESLLYKIGTTLSSFDEEVPTHLKLRQAQQESDLKAQTNKLAWDNYYRNIDLARTLSQKQNRDAHLQYVELLPHFKAQVTSLMGAPPEEQDAHVNHLAKIADSLSPGGGDFLKFFHKNQARVYMGDAILSHPDKSISGPAQEQVARMDYGSWVQSKEHEVLANQMGYDYVSTTTGQFSLPIHEKLVAKSLSEADYKTALKEQGFKRGLRPVDVQGMMSFLDTKPGQDLMVHLGVETDALVANKAKKEKPEGQQDLAKELKNQSIKETRAKYADLQAHPSDYTPDEAEQIKTDMRVHSGLEQKKSNVGVNPNSGVEQRLYANTGMTTEQIKQMPEGPFKEAARKELQRARKEQDAAAAQARVNADLGAPEDMAKGNFYTFNEKTGDFDRLLKPMSKGQRKTNESIVELDEKQQAKLGEFAFVEGQGKSLFDLADAAYAGHTDTKLGRANMAQQEGRLKSELTAWTVDNDPLKQYYDARGAALGKFARSLGGEVGVLTDQDIARVVRMFPTASDSTVVRKKKREAFNKIVSLNRRTFGLVTTGKMTQEQFRNLRATDANGVQRYTDPKLASEINGIIGSMEGLKSTDNASPEATKSPTDKPKSSGVHSLMEELEAGR